MSNAFKTWASHRMIIERAGGPAALGRSIQVDSNTVKSWKRLDSIPSAYWQAIALADIATLEEMAFAAAESRKDEACPLIYVIYGLREPGSEEFRYIGRTADALEVRLKAHQRNARIGYPIGISEWINSAPVIEIVPIKKCDPSASTVEERKMVEHYHGLGHRLTNGHLMPRKRKEK
jgi:hypothetical protein